jgi:uncharacterized protein (TIGR02678 family)
VSTDDPQGAIERREAARHLLVNPLTCAELDRDVFALIRRHGQDLDRWFTQRLGYRLHIDADTARLFKSGVVPDDRPLRAPSGRALHPRECVLLALALASTAAGPAVISLRDLVNEIRSAAAEAGIVLAGDATERRSIVTVLRWMIGHGLASEMHERVEAYADDGNADAVLRMRPDRIALLPLPALVGADDTEALFARAERRAPIRQWMRCRLVEDPVLYRDDLDEPEWAELRRRLGEEARILAEMFELTLEARAEGVAAIDRDGTLSDRRFPTTGTEGHAALLLLERLGGPSDGPVNLDQVRGIVGELARSHAKRWSNDLVAAPERLTRQVLSLLTDLRLATIDDATSTLQLLPAAARFLAVDTGPTSDTAHDASEQGALW